MKSIIYIFVVYLRASLHAINKEESVINEDKDFCKIKDKKINSTRREVQLFSNE